MPMMLAVMMGCFCITSCQQGKKGTTYTVQDSIRDKHVDSLIFWARHLKNVDSVYAVVDSLEKIKEMVRKCSRNNTITCGNLKVLKAEDMETIYNMARG